jgi:hypothetical protein
MLQDGVLAVEISAFLVAADVPRIDVFRFLKDDPWNFPRSRRVKCKELHRVFDARRVSSDNPTKVKASCSELLCLYGMLRHYVECRVPPMPEHARARASFFAACSVVDGILCAKRRAMKLEDAAALVQERMCNFMHLHKLAYGSRFIKPKHHWQMDVAMQILRDGLVLDAFVVERGHLAVKAVADKTKNTTNFEVGVGLFFVPTLFRALAWRCRWDPACQLSGSAMPLSSFALSVLWYAQAIAVSVWTKPMPGIRDGLVLFCTDEHASANRRWAFGQDRYDA